MKSTHGKYIICLCHHSYLLHVVPLHWSRSFVSHVTSCAAKKKKNSTAEFCMSMYILHFTFCTVLLMLSRNSPRNFWYCEFIDLGFRKSLKSCKLSATHEQTLSARSLPLKEIQTGSPDSGSQYYIPYVFDSVSRNRRYGRPPPVKHQGNEKKSGSVVSSIFVSNRCQC